jgi:hypothetical protein
MIGKFSFNQRFIVEAYQSDRVIKTTGGGGFAMIAQKVSLKGLKLLVSVPLLNAALETYVQLDGVGMTAPIMIPAGSIVYIKEELLHTQEWAKKNFECEGIEGKFMIVEHQFVEMIESPEAT